MEGNFPPLGEYVSLQRGTTYKGKLLGQEGPVLLGLASIAREGGFRSDNLKTYGGPSADKLLLCPNDLFVSLKDVTQAGHLLGAVARVPMSVESGRVTQDTVKLEFSGKPISREYLYWLLRAPEYRAYCKARATGTTTLGLSRDDFLSYPVPTFNDDRKNLVNILESVEKKIELNRQINKTLEDMAQALFKSWFVDFDPVIDNALKADNPIPEPLQAKADARRSLHQTGQAKPLPAEIQALFPDAFTFTEEMGWVPEGWPVVKLQSLLEIKYGKDHKKLADGAIPVYGSGGLMRHADSSLHTGESILIPRKGTLSNIMYVNEEFWTVDTMFFSIPKVEKIAKYLLHFVKSFDFVSMNVGSAVPSMTTAVLNDLDALNPASSVLLEFDRILSGYFDTQASNDFEVATLSKLRDTLLPKLISGELRIPDAEKLVNEAC